MTTIALQEAVKWHDALMLRFRLLALVNKGRNPKDSAVRSDLSEASGVPESYLYRLAHKTREMRTLDAEVYRLLQLAHSKYVSACERIEDAAEAKRQEWMELKAKQEDANATSHRDLAQMGVEAAPGSVAASGENAKTIGGAGRPGQEAGRQ